METDNKNPNTEGKIKFHPSGWKCLLQKRAGTSRILVLKSVVNGLCLERGMPIYSYVGEDSDGRNVMVSYLDGKPRIISKKEAAENGQQDDN